MATVDQNKIRKTCQKIRFFALFIMAAIPVFVVLFWLAPFESPLGSHHALEDLLSVGLVSPESFSAFDKFLGALFTAIPAGALFLAAFYIQRLMKLFFAGQYITKQSARDLRNTAISLLAYAPAVILSDTALVLALTFDNPPGQRLLSIGVGGEEIIAFLVGGLLWMVAKAFDVEKERAEEHASIV